MTKLMPPTFSHRAPKLFIVIGEKLKRRRCRPFLSHEEHRRLRHEAKQSRGGAEGGRRDDAAQPLAKCAVTHLVVIRNAVNELLRMQCVRVAAAWLAIDQRRLPAIKPA